MATALWVKTIRKHHIDLQTTVPCGRDDPREALREACHELDLPEPLWLDKNGREWETFGMTRFLQDAFLRRCHLKGWRLNTSIRTRRRKKVRIRETPFETPRCGAAVESG